jgi:hypothetical protein
MNTQPATSLSVEEVDAIVQQGMLAGGLSEAEVRDTFEHASEEMKARMRAGVLTLIRGLRSLGWTVLPPPVGES